MPKKLFTIHDEIVKVSSLISAMESGTLSHTQGQLFYEKRKLSRLYNKIALGGIKIKQKGGGIFTHDITGTGKERQKLDWVIAKELRDKTVSSFGRKYSADLADFEETLSAKASRDIKFSQSIHSNIRDNAGYRKWLDYHIDKRSEFFRKIHPKSYGDEFLSKHGMEYRKFGRKRGILYNPSITSKAPKMLSYVEGMPSSSYTSGLELAESAMDITASKGTLFSGSSLSKRIAESEFRSYLQGGGRLVTQSREPISKLGGTRFLGRPTERAMTKIFLTGEQEVGWAKELLGQTKYLEDVSTGKIVPLGSRSITGAVEQRMHLSSSEKIARQLRLVGKGRDPQIALKRLGQLGRGWEKRSGVGEGRLAYLSGLSIGEAEEQVVTAGGDPFYYKWSRIIQEKSRTLRGKEAPRRIADFQKIIMQSANTTLSGLEQNAINIFNEPIRGYQKTVDYLSNVDVGSTLITPQGKLRVKELSEMGQATIVTTKNNPTLLNSMISQYEKQFGNISKSPDLFRVHLVRKPEWYPSGKTGTGKYFDEFATAILSETGEEIGWVSKEQAKKFSSHITEGVLDDMMYGRVYYGVKGRPGYSLGLISHQEIQASKKGLKLYRTSWPKIPIHNKAKTPELYQGKLKDIIMGEYSKRLEGGAGITREALEQMYPRTLAKNPFIKVDKFMEGKLPSGSQKMKYGLIGASIVAGAMLLWKATSKSRSTPLTEGDVSQSLYGGGMHTMPEDGYQPQQHRARIVQNMGNSGYATNISMEADDGTGVDDYSSIANSLSEMSRNALGISNVRMNLNIKDDSSKVNSYTIQRQFANYLNR